jgi:hypothetical protein
MSSSDGSDDIAEPSRSAEPSVEEREPAEGAAAEEASSEEDEPLDEPEPVECPNCGRVFSGTYCPDCGQKVDASVTVTDIAGDVLREAADIQGGLWTTLVRFTLRPGEALRQYLGGVRKPFVSPGRYLLTVALLYVGVTQALKWGELQEDLGGSLAETYATSSDAGFRAFMKAIGQAAQTQWFTMISMVLLAVGFALILRRLFSDRLSRVAEALAAGTFLVAHAFALATGLHLLYVPLAYAWTGQPVDLVAFSTFCAPLVLLYVGGAAHLGFGSGWKQAVMSVLGAAWAYVLAVGGSNALLTGYLAWRLPGFPETFGDREALVFGAVTALYLVPVFIQAAVETYYHLR